MKNTIRGIAIGILLVIAISIYNSWRYSSTANGANTKTHSNGIYKIAIGKSSTKTFEIAGSNKENNAKVDIWNYGNVPAQKFYFEVYLNNIKIRVHTHYSIIYNFKMLETT